MAEVSSLLGTTENLTNLWRVRICKISRQKCRICKFLRQNFVFVNFCNKNVTFSNTRYPKIPDYSENISGRVRVLLKIIGSGRVSGTRLTLAVCQDHLLPSRWWDLISSGWWTKSLEIEGKYLFGTSSAVTALGRGSHYILHFSDYRGFSGYWNFLGASMSIYCYQWYQHLGESD